MHFRECRITLALLLTGLLLQAPPAGGSQFVSHTGRFTPSPTLNPAQTGSPDGVYYATWRLGRVDHDRRELLEFRAWRAGEELFRLTQAPGSDLYITNAGYFVFLQQLHGPGGKLRACFYNPAGEQLSTWTASAPPDLFRGSPGGEHFALGGARGLVVFNLAAGTGWSLPGGLHCGFSENGERLAVVSPNRLRVYRGREPICDVATEAALPRRAAVSDLADAVALIGRQRLEVYSLPAGTLLGTATLQGNRTFRDLAWDEQGWIAGVQQREQDRSSGFRQLYSREGRLLSETAGASHALPHADASRAARRSQRTRDTIPWPFFPFDSMRTVWNHYEQHMGGWGGDWSYLHQGLDLITPVGEPVFAVEAGIVKCVLTLGGSVYWRIAISPVQESGWSRGWLYAHLIEESILFEAGDTVQIHDFLGGIIHWHEDWGHIHFVEIEDSGLVWQYSDNEWGIVDNPLPRLDPLWDDSPPVFDDVFPGERYAFCRNQAVDYLDPQSLNGDVDIIVKVRDLAGASPWEQPANSLHYWLERLADHQLILPRTLAQVLNHPYPFYSSDYYEPWATLFYHRDSLLAPSSWMDTTRNYYQILTNSDGDTLALLEEKELALATSAFVNGPYRIFVEASDDYGNLTLDSMDVVFNNPGNDWVPVIHQIALAGGWVFLVWNDVPGAVGYRVYSSPDPYQGFTLNTSGSFSGSSWSAPQSGALIEFFQVTAVLP